jgi:hypothetical protein
MSVRFQADADLNLDILTGVIRREPRVDFQTAESVDLRRLSDPEVLAFAAEAQRILVTHDLRTMLRHFADFIQRRDSPGVLVIPSISPCARRSRNCCCCGKHLSRESGQITSLYYLSESKSLS